jgi:hypothetical protein
MQFAKHFFKFAEKWAIYGFGNFGINDEKKRLYRNSVIDEGFIPRPHHGLLFFCCDEVAGEGD